MRRDIVRGDAERVSELRAAHDHLGILEGQDRCTDEQRQNAVRKITRAQHLGMLDTRTAEARCTAARNAATRQELRTLVSDLPVPVDQKLPPWRLRVAVFVGGFGFLAGALVAAEEFIATFPGYVNSGHGQSPANATMMITVGVVLTMAMIGVLVLFGIHSAAWLDKLKQRRR